MLDNDKLGDPGNDYRGHKVHGPIASRPETMRLIGLTDRRLLGVERKIRLAQS